MTDEELKATYLDNSGRAERLREAVFVQLGELLQNEKISLGVPMESRVKSLASIQEKIKRKSLTLSNIAELDDLIGVRVILLFRRELVRAGDLIRSHFDVISTEDTGERLSDGQFGYQSHHYIVRLPKSWLVLPSMSQLGDLRVELQVRTLAQHIWAAASHKLQYKSESSVPPPLRRSIHRVSALLETVDLEFDRVLEERREYVATGIPSAAGSEPLNVDSLAAVLAERLPAINRTDDEPYADLLVDLQALGVDSAQDLRQLLEKHKDAIVAIEANELERRLRESDYVGTSEERVKSGVFFAHVGLAREGLRNEFGSTAVDRVMKSRRSKVVSEAKLPPRPSVRSKGR